MIYMSGHKIIENSDLHIPNPNLIANSKELNMGGRANQTDFGIFINFNPSTKGSIFLSDSSKNVTGFHNGGTTYLNIDNNTYYTQTLWFTTNTAIKPNFTENYYFYAQDGTTYLMQNVKTTELGNNHYKVSGYFNSENNNTFDICYITNFADCLGIASQIQLKFDALKVEKGTESTDWCPAYDDYVMQSDLDNLKAEIEQLKSKS